MSNFTTVFIFYSTLLLTFDLYVKGVGGILISRYTDEKAEVLGGPYYYFQAIILTMFCLSIIVDLLRNIG